MTRTRAVGWGGAGMRWRPPTLFFRCRVGDTAEGWSREVGSVVWSLGETARWFSRRVQVRRGASCLGRKCVTWTLGAPRARGGQCVAPRSKLERPSGELRGWAWAGTRAGSSRCWTLGGWRQRRPSPASCHQPRDRLPAPSAGASLARGGVAGLPGARVRSRVREEKCPRVMNAGPLLGLHCWAPWKGVLHFPLPGFSETGGNWRYGVEGVDLFYLRGWDPTWAFLGRGVRVGGGADLCVRRAGVRRSYRRKRAGWG